ncbi:exodeoxyribonuclease III [Haliangium sp.]|uniref:exodeoxyribonuclease III n=1 Tax=Haliangium sp. TaxID=2663208 RepID=UPI003D0D6359
MRVLSWNINGLRAIDRKAGFRRWIERAGGDVVAVQEVRARPEQLPRRLIRPKGWHVHLTWAERRGYSGVGIYTRRPPDLVETALGDDRFDREGRVQIAHFGRLSLANAYFPNGNGTDRDNSRVPFKLDFYQALFAKLEALRGRGQRVLVMGDFNTAHRDIDLARPRQNLGTSGFLPEERAELERWLGAGWIDTFRHFEAGPGHYTWWSQRAGVRERNIGWRLDYVLACPAAMPYVDAGFILAHVRGSDHCPVGVDLRPDVCEPG